MRQLCRSVGAEVFNPLNLRLNFIQKDILNLEVPVKVERADIYTEVEQWNRTMG